MNDGRVLWLDVARSIGIILVVIGHVYGVNPLEKGWVAWSVFLFHMPLFFTLSGYNFRPTSTRDVIVKRTRSLLVPYASFFILILALSVVKDLISGAPIAPRSILEQLARGIYGGAALGGSFGVFWFITCLFIANVGFAVLTAFFPEAKDWRLIAPVILLALIGLSIPYLAGHDSALSRILLKSPWNVSAAFVAMLFFWYGYFLRTLHEDFRRMTVLASAIVVAAVCIGFYGVAFSFDMKYLNYGPSVVGVLLAGALSTLFLMVSQQAAKIRSLSDVSAAFGKASLVIMFMHQFIHFSLREAGISASFVIVIVALAVPFALFKLFEWFKFTRIAFLGSDKPNISVTRTKVVQ